MTEKNSESQRAFNLLRRKRNGKKIIALEVISHLENNIQKLKEDSDSDEILAEIVGCNIELKEIKEDLKTLEEEILETAESDETVEQEAIEFARLRRNIHSCLGRISRILSEDKKKEAFQGEAKTQNRGVRLPKLDIKKFSGNPSQWRSFWESFQAAVGSQKDIEDVEKFNYLKGFLEGKAANSISGFELTRENYKEACSILEDRFGRPELIIMHHMEDLLQLIPVRSSGEVRQLRAVYDKIETNVRSLQGLGIKSDQYGVILVSIILSKVPEDIRLIITRQFEEKSWTFEILLKAFKNELEARERCAEVGKKEEKHSNYKRQENGGIHNSNGTTKSLIVHEENIKCTFCRQDHPSVRCNIVTDISKRTDIVKEKGRCFLCLKYGHGIKYCRSTQTCRTCGGKHHTSLCFGRQERENKIPTSNVSLANAKTTSLLQTAHVVAQNPQEKQKGVSVRLIFDLGSNDSYITEQLRDKLELREIGSHKMKIHGFGGNSVGAKRYGLCSLLLQSFRGGKKFPFTAFVVPRISSPVKANYSSFSSYTHLSRMQLAENSNDSETEISILIGADQYHRFVTGELVRGKEGPVATKTEFGWVLSGPISGEKSDSASFRIQADLVQNEEIDSTLKKFWEIEALGIEEECESHDEFLKSYKKGIKHNGERYEVALPRKEEHPRLPDNYGIARKRLISLVNKLKYKPEIFKQYDDYFRDQLTAGIIEEVSKEDLGIDEWTHYIPHHAVVREDKDTTKLRVVFDASCKLPGQPSLNQCLMPGPSVIPELYDVTLRFRWFPVAVVADIEKAFLMINVIPQDRDVLRFLWIDNVNSSENFEIKAFRQTRVTFGITSSPFLLGVTILKHLEQYELNRSELVEKIKDSLYVDDLTSGEVDVGSAFRLYQQAKAVMAEGSFNLRKWKSNSEELMKLIRVNEGISEDDPRVVKVLGLKWNMEADQIEFEIGEYVEKIANLSVTKRNVLSAISQIFDPVGLLSPVFITAKILMQKIHIETKEWDTQLSVDLTKEWTVWIEFLRKLNKVSVPRNYFKASETAVDERFEIHGFSDASAEAYGAAVYLRRVCRDSKPSISLITAKSRVAPLNRKSIPRLELLGAVILSKLIKRVQEIFRSVLKCTHIYCWTDSMVVLHWLKRGKDLKQFVRNRVSSILENTDIESWHHCPGKDNPADWISRGFKQADLIKTSNWWEGPSWISREEIHWPTEMKVELPEELRIEIKKEIKVAHSKNMHTSTSEELFQVDRFSSYPKLLRVIAYAHRFLFNVKNVVKQKGPLRAEEINNAELRILHQIQGPMSNSTKFKEICQSLKVFMSDNGLFKVTGRVRESITQPELILLPKDNHVTSLIVEMSHKQVLHSGVASTLSKVRTKFWIPKGRQYVKKVISQCTTCKRYHGASYSKPDEGNLPSFRIDHSTPFSYTGVDYFGPLYVKCSSKLPSCEKVWVLLFTCATSRAVHLELVSDMTSEEFILAFKRFISRKGTPVYIRSDNAKTFKSAAGKLRNLFDLKIVADYLSNKKIHWEFNLEKAPWWGGFWERLVKTTKIALIKTIRKSNLRYEELSTILAEIEAMINDRPLTYIDEDSLQPLTPAHLLYGSREANLYDTNFDFENNEQHLKGRYHHMKKVLQDAKKRWTKEYVTELRKYKKDGKAKRKDQDAKIGDLVLIENENTKKHLWQMGRVEELIKGRNNITRGAIVKIVKNESVKFLKRPIVKLFPIETNTFVMNKNNASIISENQSVEDNCISTSSPVIPCVSDTNNPVSTISSCPVTSSLGPVTIPSGPVTSSSGPVTIPSCPVTISSCPVTSSSGPVTIPSGPVTIPSCPVTSSSGPVTIPSCPVKISSCPVTSSSGPVTIPSCPVTSTSDPVTIPSCPVTIPSCPLELPPYNDQGDYIPVTDNCATAGTPVNELVTFKPNYRSIRKKKFKSYNMRKRSLHEN